MNALPRRRASRRDAMDVAADKLARCIVLHNELRATFAGTLPLAEAEAMLDDIEDLSDVIGVKFQRALTVTLAEVERLEFAEAA